MSPAARDVSAGRAGVPPTHEGRHAGRADRAGVLVALGLTVALAVLTLVVATGWWVTGIDAAVDGSVPPHGRFPSLDRLARVVTTVAQPAGSVVAVAVIASAVAAVSRSWWPLKAAVPALALLTSLVLLGKSLLQRPGPPGSEVGTTLGYFPSGHTTSALVCVGTVALLLAHHRPRARLPLLAVTAAWTLVVGWGLVWRHFHWLSDVVAGVLLGSLVLWLVFRWPLRLAHAPGRPT